MSFTAGTNKWASRAVVALQLAAWSAVGIVVLEKGIGSLQQQQSRNNNSSSNVAGNADSLAAPRHNASQQQQQQMLMISREAALAVVVDTGINNYSSPLLGERRMDVDGSPAGPRSSSGEHQRVVLDDLKNAGGADGPAAAAIIVRFEDAPAESVRSESRSGSRKRARLPRMDPAGGGGGTTAAVAMIAVGAVMLVLGPAVIVLRALDERRQERRFLKLSVQEDLPPSYAQATACSASSTANILEQAPTYSSLNLDTILDNSAAAVPLVGRLQPQQ